MTSLFDSAQYLKGVGPRLAERLRELNISSVYDTFMQIPISYVDRREIISIDKIIPETPVLIKGEIIKTKVLYLRRRYKIFSAFVEDDSGSIECVWFNQNYLQNIILEGKELVLWGVPKMKGKKLKFFPREYEIITENERTLLDGGKILPNYKLKGILSKKKFRKIIIDALDTPTIEISEFLSENIINKRNLMLLEEAFREIHFPSNKKLLNEAQKRIKYNELFLFEYAMAIKKKRYHHMAGKSFVISDKLDERIMQRIPFKLTKAQKRSVMDIRSDLCSPYPMHRLIQGDVGSGKTVVALYALLAGIANKTQSAFMAPTELLAEQHYHNIMKYLKDSNVKICLLKGNMSVSKKKELLDDINAGVYDLIIGTHSLIRKDLNFSDLGVVVIDEQHKFGVVQRETLIEKGDMPNILFMTATPIPRTLALSVFGDLDVSVIDELPPGRKNIVTKFIELSSFNQLCEFIKKQVKKGRQAYFVYPLVDKSDKLSLRSAVEMYEKLSLKVFPQFNVGLIHGGLNPDEKEGVMLKFKNGEINILISTVVIEVGIDVPNANIMVIDHAERFGLSQLHQLRGRIGRGKYESYCILLGEPKTQEAKQRIKVMTKTSDGFKIAEEDLRLRGPGEFLGTRQSGLPEFKIANIVDDFELLAQARDDAFNFINVVGSMPSIRKIMECHYGEGLSHLIG